MRKQFYSEISNQMLFTIFDSQKPRKSNLFRIHQHAELELGFIMEGEGIYYLENEQFPVQKGDLFLIRTNEQHCIPTIYSTELTSYNIHIESYFLWSICSEFIDRKLLHILVNVNLPIQHHFRGRDMYIDTLRSLMEDPDRNRFQIRCTVMELLVSILKEITVPEEIATKNMLSPRLGDVQKAICFIHDHLASEVTLEEIAHAANMSRASLSLNFKMVTGIAPYEYLIIRRIEYALNLLRETNLSIMEISENCGFNNLANFNRVFKKMNGMTPREYRKSRK